MAELSEEKLLRSIVEMATEAWRLRRVIGRAVAKLDAAEAAKYKSQFSWFMKKVDSALDTAGLRFVNVEGEPFDVGMAVTPLNMDEFGPGDALCVEQMLEPIIMDAGTVVKTGTVILGRVRA